MTCMTYASIPSAIPYWAQLIYFERSNNYVEQYEDSPR